MSSKRKTLKELREGHEENLPTHASDAGKEVPDSLKGKLGKRPAKAELDGIAVANASAKHGNAQGAQLPSEEDLEKEREAIPHAELVKTDAKRGKSPIHEAEYLDRDKDLLFKENEDNPDMADTGKLHSEAPHHDANLPTHASAASSEVPDSMKGKLGDRKPALEHDMSDMDDKKDEMNEGMDSEKEEMEDEKDSEKKEKEVDKKEMNEHLAALTRGEILPEEFKTKAQTLFEAAVHASVKRRSDVQKKKLNDKYKKAVASKNKEITEALVEKVDAYLDYIVEEWMEENKVAVESGLKTEIVEKFIGGLKGLFESHYIEIPETKEDLLEVELKKSAELEKSLNEEIERGIASKKKIDSFEKNAVVRSISEDLSDVQVSKLQKLCEGISFESAEHFAQKAKTIKNHYFPKPTTKNAEATNSGLVEGSDVGNEASAPEMVALAEAMSKIVKR